ncbi:MAG: hypothetical protein ABR587_13700 [Candidatus Binatia bacterium]
MKASTRWRPEDGAALRQLVADRVIDHGFGVYRGRRALRDGDIDVLPVADFLARL